MPCFLEKESLHHTVLPTPPQILWTPEAFLGNPWQPSHRLRGRVADLEGVQRLEGNMQQPGALNLGEVAEQKLSGVLQRCLQGLESQLLWALELRHNTAAHVRAVAAGVLLQLKGVWLHMTQYFHWRIQSARIDSNVPNDL